MQQSFQACSHNFSTHVWNEIKDLQDERRLERGLDEEETNDILEEERRIDESSPSPEEFIPMLCQTLMDIGNKCVLSITKCFSREDINLMRDQHIQSMAKYYSSLYENVDLSGCKALSAFSVDETVDDYGEDYNYDGYEDYDDTGDEVYPDLDAEESTTSSTTSTSFTSSSSSPTRASTTERALAAEHQRRKPVVTVADAGSSSHVASTAPAIVLVLSIILAY